MKAPGDAATDLPWLVPGAASLVALARAGATSPWNEIRHDPGAVLLLARAWSGAERDVSVPAFAARPEVLETAERLLQGGDEPFVDWALPGPNVVYRHSLEHAALAQALANKVSDGDGARAWVCGLLTSLGWFALAAVAPQRLSLYLEEGRAGPDGDWQRSLWGLDHASVVRRLCRHWRLPAWMSSVLSNLGLPVEVAQRLGADPILFQVVQLAVALCQRRDSGLRLTLGARIGDLAVGLHLEGHDIETAQETARLRTPEAPLSWQSPAKCPFLGDLLRAALERHRLQRPGAVSELQAQVDDLHRVLEEHCACDAERLETRKMAALAEMAAGAGHEINNPLAVISAQAQYVLRKLDEAQTLVPEEPALAPFVETLENQVSQSLKAIIGQAQRIHQVLVELMQFARPGVARPQLVKVRTLLEEATGTIQGFAQARKVRLVCLEPPGDWHVRIDAAQTRTALACLVRNAIEAAPEGGWAGLRAELDAGVLSLIVEDNGPGPSAAVREHLFDPFYSGRSAGRGRGMGLPTAWRLARQQGAEVSFVGHVQGVTRFVLTVPALESRNLPFSGQPKAAAC